MKAIPYIPLIIALLVSSLAYPQIPTPDPDRIKISRILSKYQESMGGEARIKLLKSVKLTGTIESESNPGETIALTVFKKQPNYTLSHFKLPNMEVTEGFNGSNAWKKIRFDNGRTREFFLSGDELQEFIHNSYMTSPLLNAEALNATITLLEEEHYISAFCYRLRLDFPNGTHMIFWIDQENQRDRRIETYNSDGSLILFVIPDVFEFHDGVLFAKQTTIGNRNGIISKIKIESIETNIAPMNILFDPPLSLAKS